MTSTNLSKDPVISWIFSGWIHLSGCFFLLFDRMITSTIGFLWWCNGLLKSFVWLNRYSSNFLSLPDKALWPYHPLLPAEAEFFHPCGFPSGCWWHSWWDCFSNAHPCRLYKPWRCILCLPSGIHMKGLASLTFRSSRFRCTSPRCVGLSWQWSHTGQSRHSAPGWFPSQPVHPR